MRHLGRRSPLAGDDFAEYRDEAFPDRFSVTLSKGSISTFWPSGGPQWDALRRAASGEAESYVAKLLSPPTRATRDECHKNLRSVDRGGSRPGSAPPPQIARGRPG